MSGNEMICKKDGKPMYLVKETEKLSNGEYRIIYSYKCPVCGYTVSVEQAIITRETGKGNGIVVTRKIIRQTRS